MITRDPAAFLAFARDCPVDVAAATPTALFLVSPDGFSRAEESARDNRYMADGRFDAARAVAQHRDLHLALSAHLPVACFAGRAATPDAVFPNNVFATAPGRLVVGRMHHPVRRREAARDDIRAWLAATGPREVVDLSSQPHPCELTGSLVIDRARGVGFCGLSERCDATGARLMHDAFGLRATLLFDLAPGEYHANVVLAILAGRAALVCPDGFADAAVVDAVRALYGPHAIGLDAHQRAAYAGNAIAPTADTAWMSAVAAESLQDAHRRALDDAGFTVHAVALDAIEAAGGSLRCCIGELY